VFSLCCGVTGAWQQRSWHGGRQVKTAWLLNGRASLSWDGAASAASRRAQVLLKACKRKRWSRFWRWLAHNINGAGVKPHRTAAQRHERTGSDASRIYQAAWAAPNWLRVGYFFTMARSAALVTESGISRPSRSMK